MSGVPGFSGLQRLGEGGLGDVFVATRDSTGARVAIKVLRDWSDESRAWVRTRRELKALVDLQGHPNVVHVEEVLEVGGVPHIVMEFAPGGSVNDRFVRNGERLPLADVAVIGEHAAAALTAAHQLGILHLDVKPQNLLIGGFGQVKLCDFGIAALTQTEEFQQHTQAISARYASPEQVAEHPVSAASDMYMLGATLGHLITGIRPNQRYVAGNDAWATNWPTDPPAHPGAAARLYHLVVACTASDPGVRPTSEAARSELSDIASELLGSTSHVLANADASTVVRRAPLASVVTHTAVPEPTLVAPRRTVAPTTSLPVSEPPAPRRAWPIALAIGFVGVAIGVVGFVALAGSGDTAGTTSPTQLAGATAAPATTAPTTATSLPRPAPTEPVAVQAAITTLAPATEPAPSTFAPTTTTTAPPTTLLPTTTQPTLPPEPAEVGLIRQYNDALASDDWNTVRYLIGSTESDDYWLNGYRNLALAKVVWYEVTGRSDNDVDVRALVRAHETVSSGDRTRWYCFHYRVDATIPDIDSVDVVVTGEVPGLSDDLTAPAGYPEACHAAALN